ncbi:hypothetical protein [Streptomyces sp. NPDC001833]|uniref:hypothetical protein n=1 Tax=Streptomyces sp. NPDC001833 TaxID=3154658 RepID=UPI00331D8135
MPSLVPAGQVGRDRPGRRLPSRAKTALLDDPDCEVSAFLAAGHVCAVMGRRE